MPVLLAKVIAIGQGTRYLSYGSKRAQYAARCIPEYWLVDPEAETVTILVWEDGEYNCFNR